MLKKYTCKNIFVYLVSVYDKEQWLFALCKCIYHTHKNSVPYNLPKRVTVFVTCKDTINQRLSE